MIARGDLATETSPEQVPLIGRQIIRICREKKKPVIMATQMLESMTANLQPTRAEVNDVATAVSLGVDAMMLSGETATGAFPVETVQMMKRVILSTEEYLAESHQLGTAHKLTAAHTAQDAVSLAAITLANHVGAKLILAETLTGSTALSISSMRPNASIVMASPDERVCNQIAISWGSKSFLVPKGRLIHAEVLATLRKRGALESGDVVVSAFGTHVGVAGKTDTVRLLVV
jgi:pyruvate kinase